MYFLIDLVPINDVKIYINIIGVIALFFKDIEMTTGSLNWAQFFLKLGRLYGQEILEDELIHNSIIKVPYTNFIPHLLSLGAADQIYCKPSEENEIDDLKSKLKPGLLIFYKPTVNQVETPHTFIGFTDNGYPIIEDKKRYPTRTRLGENWETKIRIANEQVIYKRNRILKNDTINILKDYYPISNLDSLARANNHRILLIGNEKKIKLEAQEKIDNVKIYSWLLMRPFLHQQFYYLTDVYSSKYKGELNDLPESTIVIYTSLDAFYNFYDELNYFSSIVLYSSVESKPSDVEALSMIVDLMDVNDSSKLIEEAVLTKIPKGIEMGTWKVKK